MQRHINLMTICLAMLFAVAMSAAQSLLAQTVPAATNVVLAADNDAGAVHVSGNDTSLRVEAHQATLAAVLAALAKRKLRYRTSIALDEIVDGTYEGSIDQVLRRFLANYNYTIKQDNAALEVTIFGERGEYAVVSPLTIIPIRQRPSD